MELKLTAVFQKFPDGYSAFVEELPGANTQGKTLEEARANLAEAIVMVLEANRKLTNEYLSEDLADTLVLEARRHQPRQSFRRVLKELKIRL